MKLSYNVATNFLEKLTKKIGDGIDETRRLLKGFLPPLMLVKIKGKDMKRGRRTWKNDNVIGVTNEAFD